MEINKDKILNGTPQKRFTNARRELMEEYTESTAKDFSYYYIDQPSSFILRNSRDIFSETYFGLPFYKEFIEKKILNPLHYQTELDKVLAFIKEAKEKGMPTDQVLKYKELAAILSSIVNKYPHFMKVFKRAELIPGVKEYLDSLFDMINELTSNGKTPDDEYVEALADTVFSSDLDPYVSIPTGLLFCKKYPNYCSRLAEISRYHSTHFNDMNEDSIRRAYRTKECICEMVKDSEISKCCAGLSNQNIYLEWSKLANEKNDLESITESAEAPKMDSLIFPDSLSVVERIYESVEESPEVEEMQCFNYDSFDRRRKLYNAYIESLEEQEELGEDVSAILEQANAIVGMISDEMFFMEWEDDGTPNAVIARHNMTKKDIERKEEEKKTAGESPKEIGELDALELIDNASNEISDLAKSEKSKESFKSKATSIKRDVVSKIRNEIVKYPSVKDGITKMDENISDYVAIFESGEEKDASEDKKEAPEKPKRDMATKIQDKALDYDAKATQKDAVRKEKFQKLKNAANAITSRPKREKKEVDGLIEQFDKWDDNRRKEFLLKPGNRHKLFKKLKVAMMYGAASKISLSMVPITFMCRHFSKQKDARIRNELVMELESEIRICEEKITDASNSGDTKSKYQLMRIRDKLKAERQRVMLNSKYV